MGLTTKAKQGFSSYAPHAGRAALGNGWIPLSLE